MYNDILLPIDMSDERTWKKPLATGIEFAQQFQAKLHLLTVLPSLSMPIVASFFPSDYEQKATQEAAKQMQDFIDEQVPKGLDVQTHIVLGSVYEEILHAADRINCDLIIMGRSGEAHSNFLLGPNAARVVRHADRSVLVVS